MFEVGDEVVCVDAEDRIYTTSDGRQHHEVCPLERGRTYKVLAVAPDGYEGETDKIWYVLRGIHIAVGVLSSDDVDWWELDRFRKVERKRTREELYALIGITDMVGQRVPEVARLPYPEPVLLPMCRCIPLPFGSEGA